MDESIPSILRKYDVGDYEDQESGQDLQEIIVTNNPNQEEVTIIDGNNTIKTISTTSSMHYGILWFITILATCIALISLIMVAIVYQTPPTLTDQEKAILKVLAQKVGFKNKFP